jgi:hypothetical protein
MSKKIRTELDILIQSNNENPTKENSLALIKTLREALDASEKDRIRLEADIRKLESFLSGKNSFA